MHNTLGLQMLSGLVMAARRLGGRGLLPRTGAGQQEREERSRPPAGLMMAVVPLAMLGTNQQLELEQGAMEVSLAFLPFLVMCCQCKSIFLQEEPPATPPPALTFGDVFAGELSNQRYYAIYSEALQPSPSGRGRARPRSPLPR